MSRSLEVQSLEVTAVRLGSGTSAGNPCKERPHMIARSTITFADLRRFLLDLGFTPSKRGNFWFFEHPPSGTEFGYRPYRAGEKVTLMDLDMTRKHLDWRGVLSEDAFEDRLKKATA